MKRTHLALVLLSISITALNLIPAALAQKTRLNAFGSTLAPAQAYPAGFGGAAQTVTGDFNGDGITDVALVDPCNAPSCGAGYSSVTVLIGNGDGSFQPPAPYATGTFEPMSVAAADLNGDGAPDLVVASQCASSANCGSGLVSVLLGNGDGTFQSPVSYPAGAGASFFVAIADFNNDGQLDLAVANQTGAAGTVNILLGAGDGTFQSAGSFTTGAPSAQFLAAGDFNNDGVADLAVANGGTQDSVSILLGNGDGSFRFPLIYSSGGAAAVAVAAADFNGDGAIDIAVANSCANFNNMACSASGSVGILLGNGNGTFQAAVSYGAGNSQTSSLAIADLDGDGRLDLVLGNLGSAAGAVSVLAGNGDGTFQAAATFDSGGTQAASVAAGDLNNDGQPDVVVINQCPASGDCTNAVAGILLNAASAFSLHSTTTTLAAALNPAGSNQAVLLTAGVAAPYNAGAISGNVSFCDGATLLSTVPVSGGQASYTASFAAPGRHALSAAYSGDANYASSASPDLSETVGTTIVLGSSLNPAAANQQVTFTATAGGVGGSPTGSVTFTDGAVSLGTFPLLNGSAAVSTASLSPGTHFITASYAGDANFQPGSTTIAQNVNQPTTTSLFSSSNPVSTGQPVTYTATVTAPGASPTGAVAFMQGSPATTWATAPLVGGQATVTTSFSQQGSFPITAVYLGNPNNQSSNSAPLTETVNSGQAVTTTTSLTSSGSPSFAGQPVTFTAGVTPQSGSIPDGETVTFYNGATAIGTGSTVAGVAVLITSSLPVGTNSVTAAYSGDGTYLTSTSRVVKQVVQLNSTTTTLTSTLNPSVYGQSVTFKITVAPQSGTGTPTGNVALKNGGNTFASVPLANGAATYSTATLPGGSLAISANYTGDAAYSASSANLTQVVGVATTSTVLTSTPNPSQLNQPVTFTATVTGQYGGDPAGTVAFTQGSKNLGTAATVKGKATINASFAATGTFPVVASYSGDAGDAPSASAPLNQVVGNTSTTTTLTSSGTPSFLGQSVTFTASVAATTGTVPDNETVTFYDGATRIGTGLTLSGVATFATASLSVGTHSMTATYAGDAIFQTSTSRTFRQQVNLNTTVTTLQSNNNPGLYGQTILLTATVAPSTGSGVPTGKITFKNGSGVLASVTLVSGSASFTTAKLPAGALALSAAYSGDSNFASSTGNLTEVVNPAATTTVLTSTPNPSALGQNVTLTATVTGQFNALVTGSVNFMNGSTLLGNAVLTNGKATLVYAFQTIGTASVTGVYSGDPGNQASASPALAQVVNKAATTTTLTSSSSPATVGQPVTFTAKVTSTYGAIPDGELVTFYDSTNVIGTGSTSGGSASMTTSSLKVGVHSITATYTGDATFATSTSKSLSETINQQSTTTMVTSSFNPAVYGLPVTFTATITSAGPTPTGTVTFKNGATPLGTAAVNAQGATTFTTATLGAGSYSITAVYSGDTVSAKSTSAVLTQVVTPAVTTMQLISSVNPASVGESINFTATVRSPTAFATGTVTFTAGSKVLGTGTLVNGSAKLAVATLPAGASSVTATFAATGNIGGCAATMTQYVQ